MDKVESYFTLIEGFLAPTSNPLLAVEELYNIKQNSMTSSEFFDVVCRTARQYNFANREAEERAIRDEIYRG